MKFYNEKHFNRKNWLLENLYKLKLNNNEAMLILLIEFFNEFNENITIELLTERLNISLEEVDKAIQSLVSRGYLKISSKEMKAMFNIDEVFEAANNVVVNSNIYDLIESDLGKILSRKDVGIISEWLRLYDYDTIVAALRTALAAKKKSIAYIDKILANGVEDEK